MHRHHHHHTHHDHDSRWGAGRRGWGRGGPWDMAFDMAERHGGGRGRRRMFDGGELKLVLLKLIEESPRHGYDLIREIEERTGGAYAPSPGVIYPTLTMLDEMGLIAEQQSEGAKKQYAITPEGSAHLAEHAAEVAELFARLEQLGEQRERTSAGPVRRAMFNLKIALKERLAGDDASDTLHDVAEILDEAARKIERL